MINCQLEHLPSGRQQALLNWLATSEAATLIECVASEVAALESQATAKALEAADVTLARGELPQESQKALDRALRYQIFLDVFEELTKGDFQFRRARLSIFTGSRMPV